MVIVVNFNFTNFFATVSSKLPRLLFCFFPVEKSNDERIELSHTRTETPTLGKKRRRPSCDSPDLPQNKKIKFETAEKLIEAIPEDVLDKNRRKLKTGFKLYQLAHR